MKNRLFYCLTMCLVVVVCLTSGNFAFSEVSAIYKIGIVDIPRLVDSSSEIKALKNSQARKLDELKIWINTAKDDIDKRSTKEEKQKLSRKYDSELADKQLAISKEFTDELETIDKSINSIIKKRSKLLGYDIVITKSAVLYGGDDITPSIQKYIK